MPLGSEVLGLTASVVGVFGTAATSRIHIGHTQAGTSRRPFVLLLY